MIPLSVRAGILAVAILPALLTGAPGAAGVSVVVLPECHGRPTKWQSKPLRVYEACGVDALSRDGRFILHLEPQSPDGGFTFSGAEVHISTRAAKEAVNVAPKTVGTPIAAMWSGSSHAFFVQTRDATSSFQVFRWENRGFVGSATLQVLAEQAYRKKFGCAAEDVNTKPTGWSADGHGLYVALEAKRRSACDGRPLIVEIDTARDLVSRIYELKDAPREAQPEVSIP